MPAIEASGLTKIYRTYRKERGLWGSIKGLVKRRYQETRAADEVSFQIEQGEFVGFLGPNGAGKTTVLKMLSGLLNPTSGDGSKKCALVGPPRTGVARAQPRHLRNRSYALRKGCRWIIRAPRSAGQNECDGARTLVRRTNEDGADLRAHPRAARALSGRTNNRTGCGQ